MQLQPNVTATLWPAVLVVGGHVLAMFADMFANTVSRACVARRADRGFLPPYRLFTTPPQGRTMRPSTLLRNCVASLATCAAVTPCIAAPVHYDEAVSGDLDNEQLRLFALDVGVNTVRGTFGSTVASFDLDSFAFMIGAGQVLAAASLSLVDAQGNVVRTTFDFRDDVANQNAVLESLEVNSPGVGSLNNSYGAGTYQFVQTSITVLGGPGLANYVFSLTVVPDATVPEPTSLALAGSALAGLVFARRRAQPRITANC